MCNVLKTDHNFDRRGGGLLDVYKVVRKLLSLCVVWCDRELYEWEKNWYFRVMMSKPVVSIEVTVEGVMCV